MEVRTTATEFNEKKKNKERTKKEQRKNKERTKKEQRLSYDVCKVEHLKESSDDCYKV